MIVLSPQQQLCLIIKTAAEKIAIESEKEHPGETDFFDWKKQLVGKLTLKVPMMLSELRTKSPQLYSLLSHPFNITDARNNLNDLDSLTAIGFWRNPDAPATALQFFFCDKPAETIPMKIYTIESEPAIVQKLQINQLSEISDEPAKIIELVEKAAQTPNFVESLITTQGATAIFAVSQKPS